MKMQQFINLLAMHDNHFVPALLIELSSNSLLYGEPLKLYDHKS